MQMELREEFLERLEAIGLLKAAELEEFFVIFFHSLGEMVLLGQILLLRMCL